MSRPRSHAKLPAYVLKWNVDIGDRINKDELLATLFIPELEQEYNLKKATVSMDQALIAQAHKLVDVADGNLKAAVAKVAETQADVGKFEALVKRWDSEVDRQATMVAERVLDQQILGEVAPAARIKPCVEGCRRSGRKNGRGPAARPRCRSG